MMMPANYSVIAENEMTYVSGGNIWDAFPALMNNANWRTFGTNLIKIIGNTTMPKFLSSTIGQIFSGSFSFEGWGNTLETNYWGFDTVNEGVNTVLGWVGALGAIYTLGTGDAKTLHTDKVLKIDGTTY